MDADVSQSARLYDFLGWLEKNRKRVAVIAGIVVVLGVGITATVYYQGQREVRASEALSNIRVTGGIGAQPPSGTAEAYLKLADEFAGTKAAARALVLGASTLYMEGKYAEAQQQFERFTREYPESPWLPQAMLGIAAALDARQQTADAVEAYDRVRQRFASEPAANEAKLALARLYEQQNKPAEAMALYEELMAGSPYGGMGAEAGMRQQELLEKHPHLAKTNPPPATASGLVPPAISMTNLPASKTVTQSINLNNLKQAATNAAASVVTNQVITIPVNAPPPAQP